MKKVECDDKVLLNFALAMLGIFILALTFNLFFKPNNLVTAGVSGLSIVVNKVSGVEQSLFIAIANVLLIILSVAALGLKSSMRSIIGSVAYSFFVFATKDINSIVNLQFNEMAICLLVGGVCSGVGAGLTYKHGYSSGGSDILTLVLAKYSKKQLGRCQLAINTIVVACGGLVFGANMIIYAVIVNYIESILIDKVQLGFSGTKIFFIGTTHTDEVKSLITKKMHTGVTVLEAKGGFTDKKQDILMCTIASKQYIELKEKIKEIDDNAFIVVSECFEALGGTKEGRRK